MWEMIKAASESPMLLAIGLALMGGAVRILQKPSSSVRVVIAGLLAAVFSGIVVFLLIKNQQKIDADAKLGLAGLAGYAGIHVLDFLNRSLFYYLNLNNKDHPK